MCSGRYDPYRIPDEREDNTKVLTKTGKDHKKIEDYISPTAAARQAGMTKQAMSHLIHRGYFSTREVAGRLLIPRSEVEALAPRPQGRPRKEETATRPAARTHEEDSGEYLSQAEAARLRGVMPQTIADLIERGRLTAVKVAGRTLVLRAEVAAFVARPSGRPPRKAAAKKTPAKKKVAKKTANKTAK